MLKPYRIDDIEAIAKALPPFPETILQLLDLLHDEDASIDMIARMVKNDPVIAGNILSTANHIRRLRSESDFSDPFAAAALIGINSVRRIVVALGMNRFIGSSKNNVFFARHSLAVAITSQELATLCEVSPEKAYIAGILHDIGQLCFQVLDNEAFEEAYRQSAFDGRMVERETALFGVNHCQIGEQLGRYWNLPAPVLSAIRTHHDESGVTSPLQAVVCLGETLARALDLPSSPKNRVISMNTAAIDALGVDWESPAMMDCFGRCSARFQYNQLIFNH